MSRILTPILSLFLLITPVSAAPLYPIPDEALQAAAQEMKAKEYARAVESALQGREGGIRDFVLGIASYRLGKWEESAKHLGKAAGRFELLADYALFYRGDALYRLGQYAEAAEPLQRLLRDHPDTPLARAAHILNADLLYRMGEYRKALAAYQGFIEKYASGQDALHASYQSALCRKEGGEREKAAMELRTIRLTYPGTTVARKADEELQGLAASGVRTPPCTPDEAFRRGATLYDLKKYEEALTAFNAISRESLGGEFLAKLQFKTGQTLFKARRYQEAEQAFATLARKELDAAMRRDVQYWLARSMEKSGREEGAFTAYLRLAETAPESEPAQEGLLQAALIRKSQGKAGEAIPVLERMIREFPDGRLKPRAQWETAWLRYLSGDFKGAAEAFKEVAGYGTYRERALYWWARAVENDGNRDGAATMFSTLLDEYPSGFYALQHRKNTGIKDTGLPALAPDTLFSLPIPPGFERAKALITLGMFDEARRELAAAGKKTVKGNKAQNELARLYIETGDFNAPIHLASQEASGRAKRNDPVTLALAYPLAYRETVSRNSAENRVPEGLVYSLMRAESRFSAGAVSPAGAIGLMQLMPATAKAMTRQNGAFDPDILTDPETNIRLGVKHLKDLLKLYNGNPVSAVAAYNAGGVALDRWRKSYRGLREDEFIENIPYQETREYVKKVLLCAELYRRLYNLEEGRQGDTPAGIEPAAGPSAPEGAREQAAANLTPEKKAVP